nr:serine/threonine-protein kinase [Paenibacillus pini]
MGQLLGGRYEIVRKIGEGGMSHVYLAEDQKLQGKLWAIKESVSLPQQYGSIQDEAELLITLSHPRLPRIVDFFAPDGDGYSYLVMDYIQGITLEKYFSGYRGKIPANTIMEFTEQLLDVLDYLHNHEPPVVFRDLKPSNIMLTAQLEVRLIDFGIARNYKQDQVQDTVKLGTVGFAAPEQYGSGQSDARSDLYGMGALMLYLSTGGKYSEWSGDPVPYIRQDIPKALIPIIRKLLQYAPEDRYQTAKEVRIAIQQISKGNISNRAARVTGAIGTQVIAVMGVSSGAGTTHTAIAIGHYLSRSFNKVAVVEMNVKSPSFSRIQQIVNGKETVSRAVERKFEVQGVDYWRQTARADVIALLAGSYNFVVIDLGSYRENDRLEEFLRADIPIIVGSGAEWRQQDVTAMSISLAKHSQHKWKYFLPLAAPDAVQRMRRQLNTSNVFSIPLQLDPFDRSEEVDRAFGYIFQGVVPTAERRKRFRFGLS